MKESYNKENGEYCYFHPNIIFVGVCPLCLNERLLILAAKQGLNSKILSPSSSSTSNTYYANSNIKSKPSVSSLPKIFVLGSLIHRCRPKHDLHDHLVDRSTSLEDESFISIKFEDNGVGSWEKNTNTTVSKVTLQDCSLTWGGQSSVKDNCKNNRANIINDYNNQCMVEHAKPQAAKLRWRKRIGQLLQVIRWRRTNKGIVAVGGEGGGGCGENSKGEKVNARNDKKEMRTLSKS